MTADQEEKRKLSELEEKCPTATNEERIRFLRGRESVSGACDKLNDYLVWRKVFKLDEEESSTAEEMADEQLWRHSCSKALMAAADDPEDVKKSIRKRRSTYVKLLPRFARVYKDGAGITLKGNDGNIIVHLLPAMVDKSLASAKYYGLSLAFYLDNMFDRASLDMATLMIDVRPGEGWPNLSANKMVSFIKAIAHTLLEYFPERLYKCLVYPIPGLAKYLFNLVKPSLGKAVSDNVVLISGQATIKSPPPKKDLLKHVDESTVNQLEKARLESFK